VAAGTVRAETYGPGQLPIAVVSGSLQLDWDTPFFTAASHRPIVITHRWAPSDQAMRASRVADVIVAGEHREVDLALAVTRLGERGFTNILAEGGPSLNGALAAGGLIDEFCVTLSPRIGSGDAKRIITGPPLMPAPQLVLRTVCEEDGYLFLRYNRP